MEFFGLRTSEHFKKILSKEEPDVKILLHAIRESLKWEREMCAYFAKQPMMTDNFEDTEEPVVEEPEDEDEDENPHSAAAIAKRYKKYQMQKELKERRNAPGKIIEAKFKGIISSSFNDYMGIYISEEDSLMRQKLDSIMTEETWEVDDDARNKVLRSSTELIFYFKKSMKRYENYH